jgi:hypothetical protein
VIFNFGYLGTNKKRSTDPDISRYKYPIPDDTPLPFGHRKIMPDQGNGPFDHAQPASGKCGGRRLRRVAKEQLQQPERRLRGSSPGQDADDLGGQPISAMSDESAG